MTGLHWKLWCLKCLKGFWMTLLFFFLVMSGWLLHFLEVMSQSIIKSKKASNKRAMGSGTVTSLIAKPIQKYTLKGRKFIQGYLIDHYPFGSYIGKVV